jgi:gluconokinase
MISQIRYGLTNDGDGQATVDANKLLEAVAYTIDDVLKRAGDLAQHIQTVATDTFWHSLMGIDSNGVPVTPLITWEDTRPQKAALQLRKELDEYAVHQRTGARFHACYWPAKLRWLATEQPEVFKSAARWLSFGEYIHLCFLGRCYVSLSMGSGTGLLLTHGQRWDEELLQVLGVQPEQLSPLKDASDGLLGLLPAYEERWPVLRDAIWYPALGDGAVANIGSGCASLENWALTIGTSSAMRVVVPYGDVTPPQGLWLYLVDKRRAVVGGALSEGGNLLSWLAETISLGGPEEIDEQADTVQPDQHGLTILPFVAGERSLGWHAEARMTITGLSLHTSPAMLLRAGMEALACRIHFLYERLCQASPMMPASPRIVASGGTLLGSMLLRHIIADTLGVAIYTSREQEASARGAALLALEALGVINDVADVPPLLEEPVQPDVDKQRIYRAAAARQQKLYQQILGSDEAGS